jgi:hypothetical protein
VVGSAFGKDNIKSNIVFPHKIHTSEFGIGCLDCHPGIGKDVSGAANLFPMMNKCSQCHDTSDKSKCSSCHRSREESFDYSHFFRYGKMFDHQGHLQAGVGCSDCHDVMNGSKTTLGMTQCISCHETGKGPVGCLACHESKKEIVPASHRGDWIHSHGRAAWANTDECSKCHKDQTNCAECHSTSGMEFSGSPHSLAYVHSHGVDARLHESDCEKCHTGLESCSQCHAETGLKPASHNPSVWWIGSKHGAEAKRDLGSCMTCHPDDGTKEPICANCHF